MAAASEKKIILGVDPGTNILGYSIVSADKNTIKIIITFGRTLGSKMKTDFAFFKRVVCYELIHV